MDAAIPASLAQLLQRFHFERVPFERLRAKLHDAPSLEALHRITAQVSPPALDCAEEPPGRVRRLARAGVRGACSDHAGRGGHGRARREEWPRASAPS